MAQGKKISELTELSSVTDNDEFLFVDKEGSGANSGNGGSNVKIKFSDLKMAITDGMKGEPGMDGEKGEKGQEGDRGFDGGGAVYFEQSPSNGSNIYYKDLSGSLGIGTDSPTAPLTIVEQSNVALKMLKSSGQTLFTIGEDGGNNVVLDSSTVDLSGNVVSSDLVIKGGNVGIGAGSTNPASNLDVSGQTYLHDNVDGRAPLYVKQDGTGPSAYFMGGSIGINTISPSRGLHVFGPTGTYDESSNTWTRESVNGDVMIEQTTALNSRLVLRDGRGDGNEWYVQNYIGGQSVSNNMGAFTVGNSSGKRQLIVTKAGNIGIGCDTQNVLPFGYEHDFENPNVKGIHIHAPQNPQVRLTSNSAGNTQTQGSILGTSASGNAYLLNEHPGADAMLATTPAIDETKLRGPWDANASNGETPGTYKAGDIVYVDHENGMRDYFHAHVDLTAPVANPLVVSARHNLYNHTYTNGTTWLKHHYLPKIQLSSEGNVTVNGASTEIGTETYEGFQLKIHPTAKFQINGYGTKPPERNASLFLNASTKGGHPAVMFGHNNAINWSVKSDPDENHDFTIRNHNFSFDENNIATPDMSGSEAVFKISNGSHSTHTSFSGSRPAQELNSVVGAIVSRNPSFSFHNTFNESTLSSGGLAEGLRNPTLARFQQNYNHTGNDGANGDYLDISIVGQPYVDYAGNQVHLLEDIILEWE